MGLFNSKSKAVFPWVELTTSEQLHTLLNNSAEQPVLLFKHSTRCSISSLALSRFEKNWTVDPSLCIPVYLDLIAYRPISNEIADVLHIEHQSPQAILVRNNEVVYEATHNGIDAITIQELL